MKLAYFYDREDPAAKEVAAFTGLGDFYAGLSKVCVGGFHFYLAEWGTKWENPSPCDGICQLGSSPVSVEDRSLNEDEEEALASAQE